MDFNLELRYYEIVFTKRIQRLLVIYPLDKLSLILDLLATIGEANKLSLSSALTKVVGNDRSIHVSPKEYAVCLFFCKGMRKNSIRTLLRVSPNMVYDSIEAYNNHELYIRHKFALDESEAIRSAMQAMDNLFGGEECK